MSNSKSEVMLKYQKAKVKLLEYDVPKEDYPRFRLNYKELAFPTVLTISQFADSVIMDDVLRQSELKEKIGFCAEFYDAAMKSREQISHDLDFLLVGTAAYFFLDNYGSAMVMLSEINLQSVTKDVRGILTGILQLILYGNKKVFINNPVINAYEKYLENGDEQELRREVRKMSQMSYQDNDALRAFFADIIYAIVLIALKNSARKLLPVYSDVEYEKWLTYFKKKKSIKMVWPSQRLIGEKGIMKGESGIVQLPTGVGKTKSIELIIRSMFLAGRGNIALIVAPLRALCNEISDDMRYAFAEEANIDQFSDLLEIDFEDIFELTEENTILICTPEKLQFILHHSPDLISEIDLFVFDEGHLFDDMGRGAMYEMLIASIKKEINSSQQMVLLSAVLPNADEILKWMFGVSGVLAYDEHIKSTPKLIGFASKEAEVHYYSESFTDEDFYIPRAFKKQELKKLSSRGGKKYFPENSSNDIALYFANQLCKNGGVAIYVSQRRFIPSILNRVLDLAKRDCFLNEILKQSDADELRRLNAFIEQYYGSKHVYTQASLRGFLPHYSSLPNGLRLAVEYAFRKGLIKSVICTSTLAQGVNIPIKYLIMTSLKSAQNMISNRNLQNLMGRAARSGVYTEGSIIVTDPKLYDQRKNGRGYYIWKESTDMFKPQNAEACSSAILCVVQNLTIDYETEVSGKSIVKFICKYISEEWDNLLKKSLIKWLEKHKKNTLQNIQVVNNKISEYKNIIGTLENEICYFVFEFVDDNISVAERIIKSAKLVYDESLAKALANNQEQELLKILFTALTEKIKNKSLTEDISKIGISMTDIDLSAKINSCIDKYHLNDIPKKPREMLKIFIDLSNKLYLEDQISEVLCSSWISGKSFYQIAVECDMKILNVEKKCAQIISYQLSFLIGNFIDYLADNSANSDLMKTIQKQVKYGVMSITEISICEKIVNDRIVAHEISKVLSNSAIPSDKINIEVKKKRQEILNSIASYPTYFIERIRNI